MYIHPQELITKHLTNEWQSANDLAEKLPELNDNLRRIHLMKMRKLKKVQWKLPSGRLYWYKLV